MNPILVKQRLLADLTQLLQREEGIVLLLAGGLALSDFDDLDTALEEALKTFNGNRDYFAQVMALAKQSNP